MSKRTLRWLAGVIVVGVLSAVAAASEDGGSGGGSGGGGSGRMMMLAIQLGLVIFAARVGGMLVEKLNIPGVLGEVLAGLIIGPYALGQFALPGFPQGLFPPREGMAISPELQGMGAVAAIVLLFYVGLETDVKRLLRYAGVGGLVGVGGVIVSFLLGDAVVVLCSKHLLGQEVGFFSPTGLFAGAVTTATSVGITARVLSERKKLDSPEGVTIISAAVIDDVLGIIVLAIILGVVGAMRASGTVQWGQIALIGVKAVGVWLVATVLGLAAARKISVLLKWFGHRTSIAIMALGLALVLGGLFEEAGLAMVIGAYVMGLSLSRSDVGHVVRERLEGVYALLVPVFFCTMGMQIDLRSLTEPRVLAFAGIFTAVSTAAKVLGCGLPSLAAGFNLRGAIRVGVGMAPRGEVGLIVAGMGLASGIFTNDLFASVIVMEVGNILIIPPTLSKLFRSSEPGLRKPPAATRGGGRVLPFIFPSPEMADFFLSRAVSILEAEGFYVHLLDRTQRRHQARKGAAVIEFRCIGERVVFETDEAQVPLVNAALYEAGADLERAVRGLKEPMDACLIGSGGGSPGGPAAAGQLLDIGQYLTAKLIEPHLRGTSKTRIINELLRLLERNGLVKDLEAARRAVWAREGSLSTGLQDGLAIPHGRTDAVGRIVCAVGIRKEGVDFGSADGKPSTIFVLMLAPKSKPAPQVQLMATFGRILNAPGRARVLACKTAGEVLETLAAPPLEEPQAANEMRLSQYLSVDAMEPDLRGATAEEVIDELLGMLARGRLLRDVEAAREAVLRRQQEMSTAMEEGLALPHGRAAAVDRLICAVGIHRQGVDFNAADGQPTRILALVVTPVEGRDPYLSFAPAILSALDVQSRAALLEARTAEEMYAALTGGEQPLAQGPAEPAVAEPCSVAPSAGEPAATPPTGEPPAEPAAAGPAHLPRPAWRESEPAGRKA